MSSSTEKTEGEKLREEINTAMQGIAEIIDNRTFVSSGDAIEFLNSKIKHIRSVGISLNDVSAKCYE